MAAIGKKNLQSNFYGNDMFRELVNDILFWDKTEEIVKQGYNVAY